MNAVLQRIARDRAYYALVFPALALYLVIGFYPFIQTFILSFYRWDGISPEREFVWLRNYWDIFVDNPVWWRSVLNAGIVAAAALVGQNGFALLLAILVDQYVKRWKGFYRVFFFLPPMLSVIVVGIVWRWILDGNFGILNQVLAGLGLEQHARSWLAEPATALACVTFVICWQGFGYAFLLFLAGLQGIPKSFYEAAEIDGANAFQKFKVVTWPLLNSVTKIVAILTVLGTLQAFGIVVVMTSGGPGYHTEVPVLRIYKEAFESYHFGYATAMSAVLGLLLMSVSFLQYRLIKNPVTAARPRTKTL
ncbi:MAG: carbohydrate ABC transporter permease [Elusimicrobiota bacterium]|jgi:raffinose/stachyose/melibiose transport system permease protein